MLPLWSLSETNLVRLIMSRFLHTVGLFNEASGHRLSSTGLSRCMLGKSNCLKMIKSSTSWLLDMVTSSLKCTTNDCFPTCECTIDRRSPCRININRNESLLTRAPWPQTLHILITVDIMYVSIIVWYFSSSNTWTAKINTDLNFSLANVSLRNDRRSRSMTMSGRGRCESDYIT